MTKYETQETLAYLHTNMITYKGKEMTINLLAHSALFSCEAESTTNTAGKFSSITTILHGNIL